MDPLPHSTGKKEKTKTVKHEFLMWEARDPVPTSNTQTKRRLLSFFFPPLFFLVVDVVGSWKT